MSKPFALIVDDEWRLAQNLACFLKRNGYEAEAVTSVYSANTVIAKHRPAVALIDLKLPDVNGLHLCRMITERFPETPVLAMSARIDDSDRQALEAIGVHTLLTKPFAFAELSIELQRISKPETTAPATKTHTVPVEVPPSPYCASGEARRSPRIVLYSHDTMGLGHMRRNILIARTLAESHLRANVLLVSGAKEVGRFELPTGVDCLVLPSYQKSTTGNYTSRHLDLQSQELAKLRSQTIAVSVSTFAPDVVVVDNVPRGALNELDDMLSRLKTQERTHLVLGLRDILDAPENTRDEWIRKNNLNTLQWHYDEVWVYGDPKIYNLCSEYGFGHSFDEKVRFTGYLDARRRAAPKSDEIVSPASEDTPPTDQAYTLCLVGGGQDGFALARAFALARRPSNTMGLLITGPFMCTEHTTELHRIAAEHNDLKILGFVQEPTRLLKNAHRVVAMGGYNTVNEILAFQRPTLLVPRVRPRQEQLVRAQRLADLGFVDILVPDDLSPDAIEHWLCKPDTQMPIPTGSIDLSGLDRLTKFVERLTSEPEARYASTN